MFSVEYRTAKSEPKRVNCEIDTCSIGKGDDNLIVLRGWTVGKRHATIHLREGSFFVEDHGAMGATEVNGKVIETTAVPEFFDDDAMRYFKQYEESLGQHKHRLLNDDDRPAFVPGADDFVFKQNCRYSIEGVVCKVPQGHYFMMGDNRDNSLDSRYWGFVPDKNIVGKAFFVWMNFGNLKRIGSID